MVHQKDDQENQLTNVVVDPDKDIEKERRTVLVPDKEGDGASLEERSESLTSPPKANC
jgi:hypothetical protein